MLSCACSLSLLYLVSRLHSQPHPPETAAALRGLTDELVVQLLEWDQQSNETNSWTPGTPACNRKLKSVSQSVAARPSIDSHAAHHKTSPPSLTNQHAVVACSICVRVRIWQALTALSHSLHEGLMPRVNQLLWPLLGDYHGLRQTDRQAGQAGLSHCPFLCCLSVCVSVRAVLCAARAVPRGGVRGLRGGSLPRPHVAAADRADEGLPTQAPGKPQEHADRQTDIRLTDPAPLTTVLSVVLMVSAHPGSVQIITSRLCMAGHAAFSQGAAPLPIERQAELVAAMLPWLGCTHGYCRILSQLFIHRLLPAVIDHEQQQLDGPGTRSSSTTLDLQYLRYHLPPPPQTRRAAFCSLS